MPVEKTQPDYYDCGGTEDIIDIMGRIFGTKMQVGFINGNILKYLKRWESKNGIEDLQKARVYLDRLIELVERSEQY